MLINRTLKLLTVFAITAMLAFGPSRADAQWGGFSNSGGWGHHKTHANWKTVKPGLPYSWGPAHSSHSITWGNPGHPGFTPSNRPGGPRTSSHLDRLHPAISNQTISYGPTTSRHPTNWGGAISSITASGSRAMSTCPSNHLPGQTLIFDTSGSDYPPVDNWIAEPPVAVQEPPYVAGSVPPESTVKASGSTTTDGILILNPEATGSRVGFLIDEQLYELDSASRQAFSLNGSEKARIKFDRGGSGEPAEYSLTPGTYEFKTTEQGWDLVRAKFKVTISNSDFPGEFAFLMDGNTTTLAAGSSIDQQSDYPISVRFDRGDGEQPANMRLESGTYHVHYDSDKGRIDLLEANQNAAVIQRRLVSRLLELRSRGCPAASAAVSI